jgi:hypothetical protein
VSRLLLALALSIVALVAVRVRHDARAWAEWADEPLETDEELVPMAAWPYRGEVS